jgi:hypothetical protein
MLRLVWTEACQCRFIDFMSVGHQQFQRFRHGDDVMEDEQIRSQMMVLDHFALLVPRVFSQEPAAAEGHLSDAELFANRSALNANGPESIASEPNKHGAFKNSASRPHRSKLGQAATYPCPMAPAALAPITPLGVALNNTHRLRMPFFTLVSVHRHYSRQGGHSQLTLNYSHSILLDRPLFANNSATDTPTGEKVVKAPRAESKTSRVIEMLKRDGGATLDEIMTEMGWQKHTTRAMLSAGGSITKNHGLVVTSEMVGEKRTYSIKA